MKKKPPEPECLHCLIEEQARNTATFAMHEASDRGLLDLTPLGQAIFLKELIRSLRRKFREPEMFCHCPDCIGPDDDDHGGGHETPTPKRAKKKRKTMTKAKAIETLIETTR